MKVDQLIKERRELINEEKGAKIRQKKILIENSAFPFYPCVSGPPGSGQSRRNAKVDVEPTKRSQIRA